MPLQEVFPALMVRCFFAKWGPAVFVRHVELPPLFSRVFRRAGFSLEMTGGMSPHPRVSLGPPLPIGVVGCAEVLDVGLRVSSLEELLLAPWREVEPLGISVLGFSEAVGRLSEAIDSAEVFLRVSSRGPEEVLASLSSSGLWRSVLSHRPCGGGLVLVHQDPFGFSLRALVDELRTAGLASGWEDVEMARRGCGRFDGAFRALLPRLRVDGGSRWAR